jgi:formylmethanofuran dehydrogenase subunit A
VLCDPEHVAYRAYGVGQWQIERILPDAAPELSSHSHDIGVRFQNERRELGLPLVDDPWRVVMSTDHPNGGSFLAYPQIIRLLMDSAYRHEILQTVHPIVRETSLLKDLKREYSLNEICIITRAGPARLLGLKHKGHLGPGADADVTIYTPHEDKQQMFELPRYVIKAGDILVDQGEIRDTVIGKTLHVAPQYDNDLETDIQEWFEKYYSVQFRNYPVSDHYLRNAECVACNPR